LVSFSSFPFSSLLFPSSCFESSLSLLTCRRHPHRPFASSTHTHTHTQSETVRPSQAKSTYTNLPRLTD
jgi:hypothetical protein